MNSISAGILLLLGIVVAINSRKIGELAVNNVIFKYVLLLCMIGLVAYIAFTLFYILTA